jgi:hypothetical protein
MRFREEVNQCDWNATARSYGEESSRVCNCLADGVLVHSVHLTTLSSCFCVSDTCGEMVFRHEVHSLSAASC